ncbi:MAG: thiamine diphosphokinase [Candidatus Kapabacteria bacterium]|jgi:thiamine pyrophosphokinase|nr:thiamine diphosphokinase [Candidatus Kapabacteria bacterium]
MQLYKKYEELEFCEISYDNQCFDLLIFLNGVFDEYELIQKLPKAPIFAADGAGLSLIKNGIIPDYIIGDLDSFSSDDAIATGFPNDRLIKISEQETNDFEKTLKYASEKGYNRILILGIHGGLYEHSLNNWSVLSRYSKFMNLTIYDKGRYGICIDQSFRLKTFKDEIISLIPKNKAILTTHNLYWKLEKEALELGIREGTHNIAIADEISIEIHTGEVFLFIDQRLPFAPEYIYNKEGEL